ncbi:hypothetical protein [Methanolobus bombayensis]|uniref:hypothetical protein n=1 Tax=Methanolobus bombayensis TaxID=38023 RepID=UPI001AE8DA4C|nr:hypothetical protein [Methanolobus bombayensis]MBP1909364.1 hypothetical protein [Methanolobus bombayensis]
MNINGYSVVIGLIVLLFLLGFFIPQENTSPVPVIDNSSTENTTNMTLPADETPLMSTPESAASDEKGWWKHEGHSTVTGSNVSASESGNSEGDSNNGDDENNNDNGNHEIPEFPVLVIPFVTILGIAMYFNRK